MDIVGKGLGLLAYAGSHYGRGRTCLCWRAGVLLYRFKCIFYALSGLIMGWNNALTLPTLLFSVLFLLRIRVFAHGERILILNELQVGQV
jgi:hypothetical protein